MALIEARDLTFRYPGAATPLLDGLNLAIEAGERLAILGGNASGKSTLARWIAGWLPEGALTAERGGVTFEGTPWADLGAAERAASVQLVGQIPAQQLTGSAFTVYDEIAFGPGNLALAEAEIRARVAAALKMCNLGHLAGRDPFTLSGGEQQRLSVAAALAMHPRVLVLDEPTANLDPVSRDTLLAELAALPGALTIVLCDVALRPALALAERFLLIDAGRVVADGTAHAVLAHPRAPEILGLPAVTEAARLLAAEGRWPPGLALPITLAEARASFREALHAVG